MIGQVNIPYSVEVEFATYPLTTYSTVATSSASSTIDFINPCLVPFGLTAEATSSPASNNFSSDVIIQLTEFQVSPARCQVTYTCTGITRKDGTASNIDCSDTTFDGVFDDAGNDGQLVIPVSEDDYQSGKITPGTYVIEITGTVNGSTGPTSETTKIEVTFTDPCDSPKSITAPAFVDQQYILTNKNAAPYTTSPVFTVDPSYCPYTFVWTITNLESVLPGSPVSAISRTDNTFNFLYEDQLPNMTQKQTVTAIATTYSKYGGNNTGKKA